MTTTADVPETEASIKRRLSDYARIGRKHLLEVRRLVDLRTGNNWKGEPHPTMSTDDWKRIQRSAETAAEHCRAIAHNARQMANR